MGKQKYDWIDIAKGLGILLVVYGHCQPVFPVARFIYAFHMPLFFFISGFLFKNKQKDFQRFIKEKAKRLLIPYFTISLLSIPVQYVRFRMGEVETFTSKKLFIGLFNLNGTVIYNRPLWFLMCLFVCLCLFYFISKMKFIYQAVIVTILFTIGYYLSLISLRLPFSIDISFLALFFIFIGYQSKSVILKLKDQSTMIHIVLFLVFGFLCFYVSSLQGRIGMRAMVIHNPVFYVLAAFSGILMTFSISYIIRDAKLFIYCGKNSLAIMLNHFFVLSIFGAILTFSGYKEYLFTNQYILTSIIYFLFYILFMVPSNRVYNFIENHADRLVFRVKKQDNSLSS